MLKLDQTTRKLQAVLSGAVTTNQLPCMVSYSDDNGTTYVGATQLTNTNSTTAVDICAAPGASTVRDIDYLSIRNRDTAAATVTVMLDDNATDYEIVKAALAVGDQLTYTHGDGWRVIDADGNLKTGGSSGTGDVVGPASATANSLARFDGTTGKLLKDGAVIGTDVQAYWKPAAIQDFRLTLTTGVPVTTSDVTAAGTIYCAPYKGNAIALYDGTNWNVRTSAEFSLALSGLTSGKPYDVFCYDNAGTPTLEFLVWTNDTTRATALAYQDGVLVKSGAATRRYMGTFYTTGTTTTEDSEANRYLWNYYHRLQRPMAVVEGTNSWTYSTASYRQANNSGANQLNFIIGIAEQPVFAQVAIIFLSSTAVADGGSVGIGLDSTSTNSAKIINRGAGSSTIYGTPSAIYNEFPSAGKHYLAWLEAGAGSNTQTWYGDAGVPTLVQAGIFGNIFG